jgi:predicted 3-demethylubiquinone-9 3-methyltransferase (glyoxalase superfamily)
MKPLTTCLWFDTEAEDAARFYVSLFDDGEIGAITRYGQEGREVHGRPAGSVTTVEFRIRGQDFVGLNGGPNFKFNEAVSFQVFCDSQVEIDRYWESFGANGGEPGPCGWIKDRFGLSWQVIPNRLMELMKDNDRAKAGRTMNAMLKMGKIDIAGLERAAAG